MAVNVGGIYFSAELDDSSLKKSIKDIENSIRLMSGTVANNVNKSAQSFNNLTEETKKLNVPLKETSSLFKSITQAVGAMGLTTLASSVINTTAKFEKYQAVLTNTYQSSDKAAKSFAFIKEFAASTPFSVDELTSSFIKFLNRGLEPTKESLTAFGDIAASQGKSFDQFTEAVLDATSGEFERLKEFGIQASKSGDQVALSFKGQTLSIRNTKEEIEKALISFGKMPGVADSMASVSKTTEGAFSNLGDAMDSLKVALGNVFLPLVKDIVIGLSSIVTSVKNFIEGLSPLGIGILKAGGILTGFVVSVNGIIGVLGLLGPAAASAGAAMSLALGPVGLIIAGLTAGTYALITAMEDAKKKAAESKALEIGMSAAFTKDGITKTKEFLFQLDLLDRKYRELSQGWGGGIVAASELRGGLESLRAKAKELNLDLKDYVKEAGGYLLIDKPKIDAGIAQIKRQEEALKSLGKTTKEVKPESIKTGKAESPTKKVEQENQAVAQSFGRLGDSMLSARDSFQQFQKALSKGDWATAVNKGLEGLQTSLSTVGGMFLDLMKSQAELGKVKFTNLTQRVDFATNAIIYAYDQQQEALAANMAMEMRAIDDQKNALLAVEEQYLIDLAMLREQFSEEEKLRNDEAYNREVALLEADYQKKLEYLRLNTADEAQFAVQKALLQEDLDAAKINLRQLFDKKLLDSIAANDKKLDTQQEQRQTSQLQQIEALDAKKEALEQKRIAQEKNAEEEKRKIIKQTELFKWAAGFNAFQAEQKIKLAQARMQLALGIMDVIRASVSFPPFSLGFLALLPVVASAGANAIAAIQSAQYPPPPVFAEGGIVGGNSFTGDQVDAKVNSREMILNTRQQAELFAMANGKNGMGTTNNIYLGGVKVESVQGGVEAIASRVSAIIRKDIYQAYGGLSA